MQIVLTDALPPAPVARELAAHLPERAPVFYDWLQHARAAVETLDVAQTGCTPAEVWHLRRAGFAPEDKQNFSAGLGPLRARVQTGSEPGSAPVWIADLVHLALGAQHATLVAGSDVTVSDAEDQALFDAAQLCLRDTGFTFARVAPGRWQVGLPTGICPPSVSPAAAASGRLERWWPQDAATRPWRRLVNELQMVWHDHPVNVERSERGVPLINGLWLYGGARPWTFSAMPPARVYNDLAPAAARGGWVGWLDALADLDRNVLATLSPAASLILSDATRLVTLTPARRRLLHTLPRVCTRLFTRVFTHPPHWTTWWHPPS